jgi:RHS repeat-associated protein
MDDATGLNYMQARYYDPIIGRFLSTDPIGYPD